MKRMIKSSMEPRDPNTMFQLVNRSKDKEEYKNSTGGTIVVEEFKRGEFKYDCYQETEPWNPLPFAWGYCDSLEDGYKKGLKEF